MNSSQTPPLTLPAFYQAQLQRVLAHQQAIEAELARRSLQDLPIEKLFRLSDLISRQLQRLLVKAPVSNQFKPDQASDGITAPVLSPAAANSQSLPFNVRSSAFEVQGSSAHPSPASRVEADPTSSHTLSAPCPSSPIKPDQASNESNAPALSPAAADSQNLPLKVQSSAFEVQGSPAHPSPASRVEADPTSSHSLSAPCPSSPIKPDQASNESNAPVLSPAAADSQNLPLKVQSSAFEVQGSPPEVQSSPSPALPASNPHTSAPQEYCLRCGEPLPALLPNGKRPDPYCKCGSPIPGAPGTSLLERCPECGELQRAHGYNAIRQHSRCHKCWRELPALNPKNRPRWLPPTRPAASLPR